MLTLDLQVQALRRRDPKNGLSVPPRLTFGNAMDIATKPRWAFGVLLGKRRSFGNLHGRLKDTEGLRALSEWTQKQFDPAATWRDVEWVRAQWPGKLVVKGIMDSDDALHAVAAGVDAMVVSNHGGRQLDSAASTISVLPKIVDTIGDRCEVLFDGGVTSGQDILKALALGARGALIGKAFLYALAAKGGSGVRQVIDILKEELRVSLALAGQVDVTKVTSGALCSSREAAQLR
jgi:L-lactate dehydrogenase (cytochrome)